MLTLYSIQPLGLRNRKPYLSHHRQLSPVLESNLSDCSASEYGHGILDTYSPFSSATSGSSSGSFPAGPSREFQPFSQPGGMREVKPWMTPSRRPQVQVPSPLVSRVQFGSMESSSFISTPRRTGHALETPGSFLNFCEDQEEEEDTVLMGFDSRGYGGAATTFNNPKRKISFQETARESVLFEDLNESQNRHQEADFLSQQPKDCSACGGLGQGSVMRCGSLYSHPCGSLSSSGSDSGEGGNCQGLQRREAGSSDCEDAPLPPMSTAPSCGQSCDNTQISTPLTMTTGDCRRQTDATRKNSAGGQVESHEGDQFVLSFLQTRTARPQKCGTVQETQPQKTRETGTQTDSSLWCTRDASTQYSPTPEPVCSSPSVWHKEVNLDTRGQHGSASELQEVASCAGIAENKLLSRTKSEVAAQQSHSDALTGHQLCSGDTEPHCSPENGAQRGPSPAIRHTSLNTQETRDALWKEETEAGEKQVKLGEMYDHHTTQDPAESRGGGEGEGHGVQGPVTDRLSAETATLQEIADILLMMKEKDKA
ncbi:hypothetical protein AGOR_G00186530 [Albula goreensis]|uniref:Uncharacterized protein n=1 Tax=Albula goreensis TaxID=1534307 RepID=A0A8T3CXV1_9TELE|nr:hypothetical protein AGOR_G00186530 [Albula goreensis]